MAQKGVHDCRAHHSPPHHSVGWFPSFVLSGWGVVPVFFSGGYLPPLPSVPEKDGRRRESTGNGDLIDGVGEVPPHNDKKTRMKSKTSHQSNENLALQTQFPFVCYIVRCFQNFHDKNYRVLSRMICFDPSVKTTTPITRSFPGFGAEMSALDPTARIPPLDGWFWIPFVLLVLLM